jgi:acyl dehydratase
VSPDFHRFTVGDSIPPLVLPAVARRTLALYAGASGDDNPIHIDLDFARAAGAGDVFAHGMLSMAYLGRLLTNWVPQSRLRSFNARFTAITRIGEALTCTGVIAEKIERDGEKRVRLDLAVTSESGEVKVIGQAMVVLS